jgi:hypothetical protein
MALLGAVTYDPAAAATASTAAAAAMTALDTTNLRLTFTCPASGKVFVRVRVAQKGATANPNVFLGVLDGATVRGRQSSIMGRLPGSATLCAHESSFLVTGLTGGTSYTWDAAYGCEFGVASTTIGWGGPNNATASDAYGAISYEVWDATGLLAGVHYDPAAAVAKATSSLLALTALDTSNLRLTFTAPTSGKVLVRLRGTVDGATSTPAIHLGVLDGATVRLRQTPVGGSVNSGTLATTDWYPYETLAVVTGLTGGTSYTWDAAYAVETIVASTNLRYGGPNNTTASDAWGGFVFEVWTA